MRSNRSEKALMAGTGLLALVSVVSFLIVDREPAPRETSRGTTGRSDPRTGGPTATAKRTAATTAARGEARPAATAGIASRRDEVAPIVTALAATLHGRVTFADGSPCKGAFVRADGPRPAATTCDEDGRFALKLAPGDHRLGVKTRDFERGEAHVSVVEGDANTVAVVVQRYPHVTGRVRGPRGEAIAHALVEVVDGNGKTVGNATTDREGTFDVLARTRAREARLLVQKLGHAPWQSACALPSSSIEVTLEEVGHPVIVRVLSARGDSPIANARAVASDYYQLGRYPTAPLEARSDDKGLARLHRLGPSSYKLVVEAEGFVPGRADFSLSGRGPATKTVKLEPASRVVVRLHDDAGRPTSVPSHAIAWSLAPSRDRVDPTLELPRQELTSGGRVERIDLAGLPPGRFELALAFADHASQRVELDLPPGGISREVDVRLTKLEPSARRVVLPEILGTEGFLFAGRLPELGVRELAGLAADDMLFGGAPSSSFTRWKRGEPASIDVRDGVTCVTAGGAVVPMVAGEGGTLIPADETRTWPSVSGTVAGVEGDVIVALCPQAEGAGDAAAFSPTQAALCPVRDGAFSFPCVPPGSYRLTAYRHGDDWLGLTYTQRVRLEPGRAVEVRLGR